VSATELGTWETAVARRIVLQIADGSFSAACSSLLGIEDDCYFDKRPLKDETAPSLLLAA
jgi:hypothetical protein